MAIQKIAMTFTVAPTGAALPTGIYDVDFQSKVNNILNFYFPNTNEMNTFTSKLDTMIDEMNALGTVMDDLKAETEVLHDAVLATAGNSVYVGGWNATANFKDKSVIHNGYWWHSISTGDNIGNVIPGGSHTSGPFWLRGVRAEDTYIQSNPALVANSSRITNEVVMSEHDFVYLATKEPFTIYNIFE